CARDRPGRRLGACPRGADPAHLSARLRSTRIRTVRPVGRSLPSPPPPAYRRGMATDDQPTFRNPATRFPEISPPKQHQSEPRLDAEPRPQPHRGEHADPGTGLLEGRRRMLTGAASGIGSAVAIAFAREGAAIALSYLPTEEEDAQHVNSVIEQSGRKAVLLPGDLAEPDFCRQVVEDAALEL